MSDFEDPSSSRLLLDDYKSHPLTALDLSSARMEGLELAFLSACTTARIGRDLPDESLHLGAACQLAGYRHVIATLWPILDHDALIVTRTIYDALSAMDDARPADSPASS